jgi:Xaa-Pro aminopeptidase
VNTARITDDILKHFEDNQVTVNVQNYEDVFGTFTKLIENSTDKVWVSVGSSYQFTSMVPKKRRYQEITPVALMKAIKNDVEVQGIRNCHVRDGLALVQYFAWLENEVENKRTVTEISGASKLEEFRKYVQSIISNIIRFNLFI